METKHCWNSHGTVYLGLKKNLPYSTKGASSYYNKNQNNGQEIIMLMVEMPMVINTEGITYRS